MFDSVVSNLRKTYPKDKMQDISTSFCFICLLHLANERGLKLEVGESPDVEDEGEPEEGDNKVGDLWGLKVKSFPSFHTTARELIVVFSSGLPRSKRRSLSVREWIPSDQPRFGLYAHDASICFLCRFVPLFILRIVLFCFRISTSTYRVVVYLPPTSFIWRCLLGFFSGARRSWRERRFDLTYPKLNRSALWPSFTLSDLFEVDTNLTFEHTP